MYAIYSDGELLFSTSALNDEKYIVVNPKLNQSIADNGDVSFNLPPCNALHGKLRKLKTILTVEQDGTQIYRGRINEITSDFNNIQDVYSEGDKAFLNDSQQEPYTYNGTAHGLFREFVERHNAQVEAEKQFVVGEITAVDSSVTAEVETTTWANTSSEMDDRLLNVYGGYLRTRTVGGVHYLDWVAQYGETNSQPIEFTVNLLDLTAKTDAGDVFTVLIPLGASEIGEDGEYTDPISIASVNGGKNYIQDDAAVALYGRIWKTRTWSYIEDPAQLLERGREYLKTGIALETLTLKAIDMHFVDGNVQPIRIGDRVRILSNPHGIDKVMTCTQIEIDLRNPENTVYTFGERPRTLTENVVKAEEEVDELTGYRGGGGGGRSVKEEASDIIRWAKILADEERGIIALLAGEEFKDIDSGEVLSLKEANLILNGAEGKAGLLARVEDQEGRVSSVELLLNGDTGSGGLVASVKDAEDAINEITGSTLWANQNSITGLVGKFTINDAGDVVVNEGTGFLVQRDNATFGVYDSGNLTAGVMVHKINDDTTVTIDADRVDLGGFVTASTFNAKMATIDNIFAGYSEISALGISGNLYAANARFTDNVSLLERVCNWTTVTMGDVVEHTLLGAGTNKTLDLAHSHAVTVDEATGLVTLGEVSAEGGNFNIADTTFHKNAVSASYNKGKTDWSPVNIERTDYDTDNMSVTVRAVNAAGVPLIALEEIDASEIFEAGAQSVTDEIVIGSDAPSKITDLGNNVYQMTVRIWARYNGETIASATIYPTKGLY